MNELALTINRPIRVLLFEQDADHLIPTGKLLESQDRLDACVDATASYDEALARMRRADHDVYVMSYEPGIELGRAAFTSGVHAPVILVAEDEGQQIELNTIAQGVSDVLVRAELTAPTLARAIRYAVNHYRAIKDLARSEERYALAIRGASDGIWDWDVVRGRIYLSQRWYAIVGLPEHPDEEDPVRWFDLVHTDDRPRLRAAIDAHLEARSAHLQLEHRIRHTDGTWRWVLTRGVAIYDAAGAPTRMAGSMSDITDRRNVELQLEHDALHDGLTGLPNRALFTDRLGQAIRRCARDVERACAVLFFDVDRFKLINDSYSHGVGDRLLVSLAGRLAVTLRPGDTVARIGGDEYALLLEGITDVDAATAVAQRVLDALERPFEVGGRQLFLTASIGISTSAGEATAAELLRNADIAMYAAKRQGRARWALFSDVMHRRIVDRLARESDLRAAIDASRLEVHYQPIIDLENGRVRAFEALARWPGTMSPLAPSDFIPIAEDTGMIGALGLHVMETALRSLAAWRREHLIDETVYMSVNVSSHQFEDPTFAAQVRLALDRAELPASALRLELTESALMQEGEPVGAVLSEISDAGVLIHLDDFGTGYSSLGTLHRLPVEALKIDRSFVGGLQNGNGDEAIIRSTIALAHSLGLQVIAEGIEDSVQLRRLRTVGCEYGQGYLFSRPVSEKRMRALLPGWSTDEIAILGATPAERRV